MDTKYESRSFKKEFSLFVSVIFIAVMGEQTAFTIVIMYTFKANSEKVQSVPTNKQTQAFMAPS